MPRLVSTGAFLIPQLKSDADCTGASTAAAAGAVVDLLDGRLEVSAAGGLGGALACCESAPVFAAGFSSVTTAPESGAEPVRALSFPDEQEQRRSATGTSSLELMRTWVIGRD
jgi:hypothetical protein